MQHSNPIARGLRSAPRWPLAGSAPGSRRVGSVRLGIRFLVAGGVATAWLGCGSIAKFDRDLDDHPVTDTGVAAMILMPGQTGIPMPNRQPHGGLGPPVPGQAAPNAGGRSQSSGAAGGARSPSPGGMMMIGGASQDIEKHQKVNNEPAWAKALKLPFLVAAYPFKKVHQAVTGPADPTVKITGPPPPAPPTPAELQARRERSLVEGMERELAGQPGAPPSGTARSPLPQPATGPAPSAAEPAPTGRPSIAEELAALRRAMAAPSPGAAGGSRTQATAGPGGARSAAPTPTPPETERLYESVDRDSDGRADRWIYRTGREVTAEATDDDGDGRPERTVHFAPGTREPMTEEEDTNADGRPDTYTEYESSRIARRRADTDGDGEIDTWSFYQNGKLARHEQDTDGDGFRDRMSFYQDGRLVREEEDQDGNGRPDRITHYDGQERIDRQEEDTNRDGVMDVRSFYREGKLRRRELIH